MTAVERASLAPIYHRVAKRTLSHYSSLINVHTHNLTEEAAAIIHNTSHFARVLPVESAPYPNHQRNDRAPPCRRFHPSILARPFYVHRMRWPCDGIESATNLEASERANRPRKRRRGRRRELRGVVGSAVLGGRLRDDANKARAHAGER